jgi:chaperone modulatory protein CbpM
MWRPSIRVRTSEAETMTQAENPPAAPRLVDDDLAFDLEALCQACGAATDELLALVEEGVLEPRGPTPQEWRFGVNALPRARLALRLQYDLQIDLAGVALALVLLDRIESLETRLRRLGAL